MHIVVVGAGILGASTAFHLARAGARVTVVDQAHEGRATAAGAGIICPWVSRAEDAPFYRLYCDGARYYGELVPLLAELGETDLGFRRVGAMVVSSNTDELSVVDRMLHRRRADTPEIGETRLLTPRDARALFPPLRDDLAALYVAGGARVDGRRMAASLLRAAQHQGATLRAEHAELASDGNRVTGVTLRNETIYADRVVVAAGAWAPALLRPVGIAAAIEPQRGQIVHLRLPGQDTREWPVVLPPSSHYLLAFDDSRVVAGATRESGAGFDYRVTAAGQAEVLREALQVAPGLATATVIETRVGFRPVAAGRPLLGSVSAISGLLIGNGLGAAGLTIGPFAGRLLADIALEREPMLDLSPFNPLRHVPADFGRLALR